MSKVKRVNIILEILIIIHSQAKIIVAVYQVQNGFVYISRVRNLWDYFIINHFLPLLFIHKRSLYKLSLYHINYLINQNLTLLQCVVSSS